MTINLFRQHYQAAPVINADYWSFMLGGMVEVPLPLSYRDLTSLPATEVECALACIGNTPGGPLMGQARWEGVPLQTLLNEVHVLPEARYAHLHAADGYATSIDLAHLNRALLAYRLNGDPLPQEHGFPVRLVVPGLYGYKMPKWIQRVELAEAPLAGLWEKRGWSALGRVRVTSAIQSHQIAADKSVLLRGMAFAGENPLRAVEISIDGGPWMPVTFSQRTPFVWAEWSARWEPPGAGHYHIRVRATDSSGQTQTEDNASAYPDGSSGIHAIVVSI